MDSNELKEEIAHQQILQKEYRKRLRVLEQQAARFGSTYVPAHIQIDIDELREKLRTCEQALTQLGAEHGVEGEALYFIHRHDYTRQRVQRVMLLSLIIGGSLVLYTVWALTRPVSAELIIANFAVGLVAGILIDIITEVSTQRFKE